MNKLLKIYWFNFDDEQNNTLLKAGVGVTAYNYNDALSLIKNGLFKDSPFPAVESFIEDVDVSKLDSDHIRPNMGPVSLRGIWYPLISLH